MTNRCSVLSHQDDQIWDVTENTASAQFPSATLLAD